MARQTIDPNQRKQPVSVSLTGSEIVMLDNLAKAGNTNRSALLAALITGKALKDLGLSAFERHQGRQDPDTGACNPNPWMQDRCLHPRCQKIFKEMGL